MTIFRIISPTQLFFIGTDEDKLSSGDHQETRSEDVSLSTDPNDANTAEGIR